MEHIYRSVEMIERFKKIHGIPKYIRGYSRFCQSLVVKIQVSTPPPSNIFWIDPWLLVLMSMGDLTCWFYCENGLEEPSLHNPIWIVGVGGGDWDR